MRHKARRWIDEPQSSLERWTHSQASQPGRSDLWHVRVSMHVHAHWGYGAMHMHTGYGEEDHTVKRIIYSPGDSERHLSLRIPTGVDL